MPTPIFQAGLPISIDFSGREEHFAEEQHYHNTYEISVQLGGSRTLIFGKKRCPIPAGTAYVIRPCTVHGQEESGAYSESFTLKFSGEVLNDIMDRLRIASMLDKLSTCIIDLNAEQFETMRVYLSQIARYYRETEAASRHFVIMSMLLLLDFTAKIMGERRITKPIEWRTAKESSVLSALDYINGHLSLGITLNEASDYVHMSRSNFCRIFKRATGVTFNRYLSEVRAEAVKRLLSDTNLTLKDIAKETGFGSADYMSKIFKKTFGTTPTKYRTDIRKKDPHKG